MLIVSYVFAGEQLVPGSGESLPRQSDNTTVPISRIETDQGRPDFSGPPVNTFGNLPLEELSENFEDITLSSSSEQGVQPDRPLERRAGAGFAHSGRSIDAGDAEMTTNVRGYMANYWRLTVENENARRDPGKIRIYLRNFNLEVN